MKILDTNMVIRYLLQDVPEMFETACESIRQGDCSVYPEVVAEAVYVLKSVYKVERRDIAAALIGLLDEVLCEKREAVEKGLQLFAQTTLDFVDCLLIAYHRCYGDTVLTFDKKLKAHLT